ncbi:MAG: hypothetical protein CMJ49_12970 [Planctomycetaceae bacterium]|nr:hypothetical protein [Planctomycetaceae bacterium]
MRWKLACADFTFPLLDHGASLSLIASMGIKGVDLGLFEGRGHLQPSREYRNVGRSAKAVKKKLDDRGLKAADVFLQMSEDFVAYAINRPEAARRRKARDWFARTLEYAAGCGAKHVTALPGVEIKGESRRDSLSRAEEELAWRVDQAKGYRIKFSVEAHIGSIVSKPKLAVKLVEAVPGLTLTVDYTHFTRMGMPDSAAEPLIAHASHFHVRGARKGRLQASFKDSTIDYGRVLKAMARTKYKGWIGIEYVWIDWEHCNEVDNLSETVQYRDFLLKKMG